MKKYFNLFLVAVMCMTATLITSCSDDDPIIYPVDEEMVGNYKGTLKVNVDGIQLATMSQKISIANAGENSIDLSLKDFSFMGMPIGNVELKKCPLTQEGETYSFVGNTKLNVAQLMADVEASGKINKGNVKIDMNIKADLGGVKQNVKVLYEGNKLKGTESSEAKITSFIFDRKVAAVDSLVVGTPVIDEAQKTITFLVADTAKVEDLAMLVPTIEVSDKAVLTPGSGVAQDFSNGNKVKYTVEAEDGTVAVYEAFVKSIVKVYNFENWGFDNSMYKDSIPMSAPWTSCNNAVALVKNMGPLGNIIYKGGYPVSSTTDAYTGKTAALLESVNTVGGSLLGQKVPKVTAASMFLGTFNAFAAIKNPMLTTSFGIPYDKQPLKVTGYYKYTPGAEFYNNENKLVADKIDECSMSAVLYEVEDYKETLDGSNIYTSDKIVAQAMFKSNKTVTEYTAFELDLKYVKEYNPSKKYKFTIVLSASADGANYNAAIGSKLIVDEVMVVNK